MSKLKCCPFCGGEAKTVENNHYTDVWSVMCKNCFSESDRYHTEELAIEKWNRRKPMEQIKKQLKINSEEYFYEARSRKLVARSAIGIDKAIEIVEKAGAE